MVNIMRADNGNIGRIPGRAQVWTRAAVMPGEDPKRIADAMQEVILSVTDTDPWLAKERPEFSWIILGGRSYPAEISETHESVKLFRDSIGAVTGNAAKPAGFVSPADMQQLLNIDPRTPTFMFGPGSITQAHTEDEYVPVDQVVKTSAILADFILRWCGVE
ncbi:MAG: M20/M25/M40 family metallo-hydrolase [Spirochaetales bacterium]|nr:MAG: M20/M25/M40 family metallo-hydrolase [Spirochaetales bacterium]